MGNVSPRLLGLAVAVAFAGAAAGAQAAQVEVNNRLKVACTLQGPNLAVVLEPGSNKAITIDDAIGTKLKVACKNSGLDKEEAVCEQVIGGAAGGGGRSQDKVYDFRYVTKIHVFAQIGRWLVCSSI